MTHEIKNPRGDIEKAVIQVLQKNNIFYSLQGVNSSDRFINEDRYSNTFVNTMNISNNLDELVNQLKDVILNNQEYSKKIINEENLEKDLYDFLNSHIKKGDS